MFLAKVVRPIPLFKTFPRRGKCFEVMKIASSTGEMFSSTLFSFCCPNLLHLCLKNPILDVEFSFHLLIFQFSATYSLFMAFFSKFCPKQQHFCSLKHFHGREFNFHGMNAQSTTVDLISNYFLPHFRDNCEKQEPFIYKLTLVQS